MKILHRHDGRVGKHVGQNSRVPEERLAVGIRPTFAEEFSPYVENVAAARNKFWVAYYRSLWWVEGRQPRASFSFREW
jgi:hypothetical protein